MRVLTPWQLGLGALTSKMKLLMTGNVTQGTALALLSYCASSIIMTLTNKLVLSQYAFHLNFLLLGIQSLVTILLLKLFASMDMLTHAPYNPQTARIWFPVSLALVAMVF
jgi:GDP-mannose transporter